MEHGGCQVCEADQAVHSPGGAQAASPGAQEDGRPAGWALPVHQGAAECDADHDGGVGLYNEFRVFRGRLYKLRCDKLRISCDLTLKSIT